MLLTKALSYCTQIFVVFKSVPNSQDFLFMLCCFFVTDGANDSSALDREVPVSPVPLQRTKPGNCAPLVPREPPPRQALMPRPSNRQDRQSGSDAGKTDGTRQRPDSSSVANGESGVCVSRAPSFQSRRPLPKGTSANKEGVMNPLCLWS